LEVVGKDGPLAILPLAGGSTLGNRRLTAT
jgi:hypothetical protein